MKSSNLNGFILSAIPATSPQASSTLRGASSLSLDPHVEFFPEVLGPFIYRRPHHLHVLPTVDGFFEFGLNVISASIFSWPVLIVALTSSWTAFTAVSIMTSIFSLLPSVLPHLVHLPFLVGLHHSYDG